MGNENKNTDNHRCALTVNHGDKQTPVHKRGPVVTPGSLSDKEIERRTGFVSESVRLCFIFIVNNA
eukprot:3542604-Ditylum_brightwellii.AAC.1